MAESKGRTEVGCPGAQVGVRHPALIVTTHSGKPPMHQLPARRDGHAGHPALSGRSGTEAQEGASDSPDAQETVQVCALQRSPT